MIVSLRPSGTARNTLDRLFYFYYGKCLKRTDKQLQVSLKNPNHGKYQKNRYSYSLIPNLRISFLNLERHVDVLAHA